VINVKKRKFRRKVYISSLISSVISLVILCLGITLRVKKGCLGPLKSFRIYQMVMQSAVGENLSKSVKCDGNVGGNEGLIVLETLDLWKIYRVGKIEYPALRGVSIKVRRGEFVAVVGPSGSGKTTLLNLIGALDRPTKGEVYVDRVRISRLSGGELSELRNRKIGFVFQSYNLIPYMTALQNVELPMIASGVPPRIRKEKASSLLEDLGLGDKAHKRPSELSAGEQQRVSIARAMANGPSIILADEPTGNLDSKSAQVAVEIFRNFCDSRLITTVMVTHNMEITRFCDRIVYLRDGQVEREVSA